MRIPALLLTAATVLLAAGPACAGDAPVPPNADPRGAFAETDRNHDGAIDREEYQERIVEVFYFADANKDGTLDAVELQALVFPDDFRTDDRDANGRVSLREFLRVRFRDFDAADRDDDGTLSVEEVVRTYEGKRP
jgi:Ca2+-binding EF-hand superfamily protein